MPGKKYVVIAAAIGSLSLLASAPVFSRDIGYPYSANETGEDIAQAPLMAPAAVGRLDNPAPTAELLSTHSARYPSFSIYPYSPNESGD